MCFLQSETALCERLLHPSLPAWYTPRARHLQKCCSDIISQKRQQIPHNQSEYADSQIFGDRGLTLPLPQAVLWICSPVPLLILSRWNQLTTQQFQNYWSSISQSPSFPLLLSLLLGASSFFIMSLNSFFLLCIFPFPGYILPHLWALLSCLTPLLSNVTLLFSLKFPLPWPKSLRHTALCGWVIIPERSPNEWL